MIWAMFFEVYDSTRVSRNKNNKSWFEIYFHFIFWFGYFFIFLKKENIFSKRLSLFYLIVFSAPPFVGHASSERCVDAR